MGLTPMEEQIIAMRLDGKSYAEIGKEVGVYRTTIALRVNKAISRLEAMTEYLKEMGRVSSK